MSKWICEVIKDFNGLYYCNMYVDGKRVDGLPEYVDYNALRGAIRKETGVEILKHKDMIFERLGRKYYALLDATQRRKDCRVTLSERLSGWEPCFDKYYNLSFAAEDTDTVAVRMTEREAEIVKRVLGEASGKTKKNCGSVKFLGEVKDDRIGFSSRLLEL